MKSYKRFLIIALLSWSFGQAYCQMIILSGPEKGSYNRFAGDIVKVLGETNSISLINLPTGGSAYNFRQLTDPRSAYKIALIQSDYLNLMEAEDRLNNTGKTVSLKVVFQLAREEIHIVAKKSSGIKRLQDLDKKRVAIGNEDQGSFATGKIIRERSNVNWTTVYSGFDQMVKDLSEGTIDAFITVGSAPVEMLDIDPQVMKGGPILLELDDFNGWAKFYENDTVKKSDYKWLDKDIPTFGVRTLLIVNESKLTEADKKTVASIKSGIIQNLDILKKQGHPKWKEVIIPDDPSFIADEKPVVNKAPAPAASLAKDAVVYRVQIYSRNYQKKEDPVVIGGKSYQPYTYFHLGAFRYTIGEFGTLASAAEVQKKCRESGYREAFVAAFKNGVRANDPALFK
jgi:uncharacterized protein